MNVGTQGTRSGVCHHALEDLSSVQVGAVLGAALRGVYLTRVAETLLWSLPSLLLLQPTEGFAPLKSKFLTF